MPNFKSKNDLKRQTDTQNPEKAEAGFLSISKAAKYLGVSPDTLRNWEQQSKLIPQRTQGGARRYKLSQLSELRKELNPEKGYKGLISISKASKALGISPDTLRNWEQKGIIRPQRTEGGARRYTRSQISSLKKDFSFGIENPQLVDKNDNEAFLQPEVFSQPIELNYSKPVAVGENLISELLSKKVDDEKKVFVDEEYQHNLLLAGVNKQLTLAAVFMVFAVTTIFTLLMTTGLIASYLIKPEQTKAIFASPVIPGTSSVTLSGAKGIYSSPTAQDDKKRAQNESLLAQVLSPFNTLAVGAINTFAPQKASELGLLATVTDLPRDLAQGLTNPEVTKLEGEARLPDGQVLAESTPSGKYLEINLDTKVNGEILGSSIKIANTASIDGPLTLNTVTYTYPNTQGGAQTFLQNDGEGNLAWTEAPTPDLATTTIAGIASFSDSNFAVSTAGLVTIKSGGVTTTEILDGTVANADLANSKLTVTAGSGLSGGGDVSLGSSVTLSSSLGTSVDLTSEVTGVLPIANGGSAKALTLAAGGILWTDSDSFEVSEAGTSGQVLVSNGSSAPSWSSSLGGGLITADSLDFTEFKDAMTLDASTDIATAGFTLSTSGTGEVNLASTGAFTVAGATTLSSTLGVTGTTTLSGNLAANGDTALGNATTDLITFTGRVTNGTSLLPAVNLGSDLGSSSLRFNNIYVGTVNSNAAFSSTGQAVFTYEPASTAYTESSVLINPTAPSANTNLLGIGQGGEQRAGIDAEGDLTLGYDGIAGSSVPTTSNPFNVYNHGTTSIASIDTSGNLTLAGTTFTASSLTTLNCSDCIDFDDIVDSATLDTDFAIAQGTNTWTQTFTGTTTDAFTLNAASLSTGTALTVTGPSSTGITDDFIKATADIGSGAALMSLNPDFSGSSVTGYGLRIQATDSTSGTSNTDYGINSVLTLTNDSSRTARGIYSSVTSSSTSPDSIFGVEIAASNTGALSNLTARSTYGLLASASDTGASAGASSTRTVYGGEFAPTATGATAGTTNVYGVRISAIATHAADAGTVNNYGLYVANSTSSTNGTSTKYGLYVEPQTSADANYGAYFGSSVGILDTTPDADLDIDSSATTGDGFGILASSITTGQALQIDGPTATGVTGNFVNIATDVGSAGALMNLAPDFSGAGVTGYGLNIAATDSTSSANTDYGLRIELALSGNAAKIAYGLRVHSTDTSTTGDASYGILSFPTVSGAISTGTREVYGLSGQPQVTSASTGGTTYVYGLFAQPSVSAASSGSTTNVYTMYAQTIATAATSSTAVINGYGLYIDSSIMNTEGTSTNYGLYVAAQTGADTNYAAVFAGGNVGIGTTSPSDLLTIASSASNAIIRLTDTTNYWQFRQRNSSSDQLEFVYNGGAPAIQIENDGDIGLNNEGPNGDLDVRVGGAGANDDIVLYRVADNQPAIQGYIDGHFSDAGTYSQGNTGLYLQPKGGYTQIGSTSTTDALPSLWITDADGACQHNPEAASETVTCSSDARLKTNIRDTGSALDYFSDFRVRDYHVNATTDPNATNTGVIAQEIMQTHPELVTTGRDGYYMVAEPNPFMLVKAVQELNNKVENALMTIGSDGNSTSQTNLNQLTVTSDINAGGIVKASDFMLDASNINLVGSLASVTPDSEGKVNLAEAINAINDERLMINDKIATQSAQIASLDQRQASDSAVLAETKQKTDSLADAVNSTSSTLTSLSDQIQGLLDSLGGDYSSSDSEKSNTDSSQTLSSNNNLTPVEQMFATDSAKLADLDVSNQISTLKLAVSDTLKSLGETFLGKTTVAGDFSQDGTLSITEGKSINAIDTLYFQNSSLANAVDFFNGKVTINQSGVLGVQKLAVSDKTLGSVVLPANRTTVTIETDQLTNSSKIFTSSDKPVAIAAQKNVSESKITLEIAEPLSEDLNIDWWIVDER